MINAFTVKRHGATLLSGLIPTIMTITGLLFYNILMAAALFFIGLLISAFLSGFLLRNPFTNLVEGKGVLVLTMDSTGMIQPYTLKVRKNVIEGNMQGENVEDMFNRNAVFKLKIPKSGEYIESDTSYHGKSKDGKRYLISLNERDMNDGYFNFLSYPAVIYNTQFKSLLTKDFFSDEEKYLFSEHSILNLNRQVGELLGKIRDFARYIVESTKPGTNIFSSKWTWIIIAVGVGIVAIMFLPSIINTIGGTASTATSAFNTGGEAIQPR